MTNTSVKYSTFIASINSAHCFPSAAKKADVCIYQASTNPPQYKVISRQHWQFVMHAHCSTTLSNVPAHSLYWNDKIYIMQVLLKDVCVELPQVHKIAVLCRIFRECSYLSRHSLDNSSITVNIHSFINREIRGKNRGEWKGRQSHLACATSALPLSYNNQTTGQPPVDSRRLLAFSLFSIFTSKTSHLSLFQIEARVLST